MQSDKQAVALSTGMNLQQPASPATPRYRRLSSCLLAPASIAVMLAQTPTTDAAAAGSTPDDVNLPQLTSGATANPAKLEKIALNIPAQPMSSALTDLGAQTGLTIIVETKVTQGVRSDALRGTYTADEALKKLLEPAGLRADYLDSKTVAIRLAKEGENLTKPISSSGNSPSSSIRLASATDRSGPDKTAQPSSAEGATGPSSEASNKDSSETSDTKSRDSLQEVVVTGTHIRNGQPTYPIHTLTRVDIDQSGYSQVGELMRSLPENFSGGQNPGVIAAGATSVGNQNISNASTVNLRGLGTDATLTLLNGHRLAADSYYQGSDISGIPLAAVERIEVVPDGASALYGSDAVAGVANIILRKNYNGVEVSARGGGATQGGAQERTYSVLGGASRDDWFALLNAEYSDQGGVTAAQRDFTSQVPPDGSLLMSQQRRSLFLSAGGRLSDNVSLSFDGLISNRDARAQYHYTSASALSRIDVETPNYSAATTLDIGLPDNWKLHVTGVASGSRNAQHFEYPAYGISGVARYKNELQYGEATIDGTLLRLPTGDVKVAFGGGYRQEGFREGDDLDVSRHIVHVYAEAFAPLVAPSKSRTGLHELEVNVSARREDYSDFGSTTNPRVGLRYVPFNGFTLRSTWGKSFKAPSFVQMYDTYQLYLYPAEWFGYTGGGTGILAWGGNAALTPERSKSWTFGADFSPAAIDSLTLSATLFDIDYTDRVVQPIGNYTLGLSNPIYAPFVQMYPDAAAQAAVIAAADGFQNSTGAAYDPTKVVAILQDRYANAAAQTVSGMDFSYRQSFKPGIGGLNVFANATWLRLKQQTIATAPTETLSGTIFNVPQFKGRAGLSWQYAGLTATGIINYVSSETDNGITPHVSVGSWTTLDANIAYTFLQASGFQHGVKIVAAATNLLDAGPPRTETPTSYPGLHFDSTNHSIMGRFVSLTVSKAW